MTVGYSTPPVVRRHQRFAKAAMRRRKLTKRKLASRAQGRRGDSLRNPNHPHHRRTDE